MGADSQLRSELLHRLGELSPSRVVERVVGIARRYLAMDMAFVVELDGDTQIVRVVDGDANGFTLALGSRQRLEETYCGLVLRGEIPSLIADASREPKLAGRMAFGSYVGVPIRFSDGRVFGVLACAGRDKAPWLDSTEELLLRVLADVLAGELESNQVPWEEHCRELLEARAIAYGDPPTMLYQPVVDLASGHAIGFEALARFTGTSRATDEVFRRAWRFGYGAEQERGAVSAALTGLARLPEDAFLAVNVAPRLPMLDAFESLFDGIAVDRIVLELTEHSRMDDPADLRERLAPLRARGLRIAIDDAGAGFAGLNRIIDLEPEIIKLDAALVRHIDGDARRIALAAALVEFGARVGARIVAEGIEGAADLLTLRSLGVTVGQGWHIGRPVVIEEIG